ncbi:type III secretion system inner rod subunit SctI [Vibrio profundum]|uniref:type III secretion system inner rod subunit SctI n=1 Tax=Vibrio profundum TaxID=2910247 RepID=UPI003D0A246E
MDVTMIQKVAQSTGDVGQEWLDPSPHHVDAFNKMMAPSAEKSPAENMISGIQEIGKHIESTFKSINVDSIHQLDPEKMVATQLNVVQSVVEVEFVAKMAGSASQVFTKLTSMQ